MLGPGPDRRRDYENGIRNLETDWNYAKERFDQARVALSRVLPANVPLYYTYEVALEELKDQQYEIVNVSAAGRGQIRIAPGAAHP